MMARDVAAGVEGVLAVDKPSGPTSHDVVARARRVLGTRRIGHTGTLDPFASGLLLLCIGRATRIAEYLIARDKSYSATVVLGSATDTDDSTGEVISTCDAAHVTRAEVEHVLEALRGDVRQLPPAYSAKKVAGERAYAIAREGRSVLLEPVDIRIEQLEIRSFDPPHIGIDVTCSSGTYIRAIARDIGAALGTGGHLSALRRTAIGAWSVDEALSLDTIEADPAAARAALVPAIDALHVGAQMPRVDLAPDEVVHITHGRIVSRATELTGSVALAADGALVAIADSDGDVLRPRKVFL